MATEYDDLDVTMFRRKASKDGPNGSANQERVPIGVAEASPHWKRLDKWRDVCRDDDHFGGGRRARQQDLEPSGIGIGEGTFDGELSRPGRLGREFGDEAVVVEKERGVERVAMAAVGPAIDADEGGRLVKRSSAGGSHCSCGRRAARSITASRTAAMEEP